MFAWLADDNDRCDGCGQPLSESAHPEADPMNPDQIWTYAVSNPVICHSCEAIAKQQKRWAKAAATKDRPTRAVTRRQPWSRPRR